MTCKNVGVFNNLFDNIKKSQQKFKGFILYILLISNPKVQQNMIFSFCFIFS